MILVKTVLITAFGDILTAVDPQMLSFEFVFSGGVVEPWDSHWFNYAPATASVVTTEWLTGALPSKLPLEGMTREDLLTLGRAPTYEEIMSVIARYPGEDEPLYVPAEDEAIWLTDLEGHADIYDNDSIKINYAPGFDQSRITKIEAYRNGVEMEFLPAEFDIVTNDQMKTFDGNPLENTPASSHTDHAIFGYEYEIHVYLASGLTQRMEAEICNLFTFSSDSMLANIGANWNGGWYWEGYSDSQVLSYFSRLLDLGFEGIQFNVNILMETLYSNEVSRYPWYRNSDMHPWLRTATDEEIGKLITLAHESGLEVEARILLFLSEPFLNTYDGFAYHGNIRPTSIRDFFDSYADVATEIAAVLEGLECERFVPFTEMNSLERHPEEIKRVFDRIAEVYSGELAFEESTNHYLAGFNTYDQETRFERNVGDFWNWESNAGEALIVEWSCWSPQIETSIDQRFTAAVEGMLRFWEPALTYYKESYPSNRIRFGEMGVYDQNGVGLGFEYLTVSPKIRDSQEVSDIWAAYLIALEVMGIEGGPVWEIQLCNWWHPDWLIPGNIFLIIDKTPALRTIQSFLTSTK